MKSTIFNTSTRLYLTIPNMERTSKTSAWYIFIPILGQLTDAELLTELENHTACIQDPEEELKQRGEASSCGGLWVEVLAPPRCSKSDAVLRLFVGLKGLQDFVGVGDSGAELALARSPKYGVGDFSGRFPHVVL